MTLKQVHCQTLPSVSIYLNTAVNFILMFAFLYKVINLSVLFASELNTFSPNVFTKKGNGLKIAK